MITDDYNIYTLLLPMVGDNNGTVIQDFSKNNRNVYVSGNARTSTTQSKFYDSSCYFDGSGDYLSLDILSDFRFGTGDFTISGWVYLTSIPGGGVTNDMCLFGELSGSGYIFLYLNNVDGSLVLWNGSAGYSTGANVVSVGVWTHFACTRESSTLRLFLDGVKYAEAAGYTFNNSNATESPKIGGNAGNGNTRYLRGYLQDFLLVKGQALWTADFTPPSNLAFYLQGVVKDEAGAPAQRTIFSVPRDYPVRVFSTQSDVVTGAYSLAVPGLEQSVVALHSGANIRNDLVTRVLPG